MDTALIERILRTDFSAKSVEKLRTLILQLAASGKITSKSPSNTNVDKLIREITQNRKTEGNPDHQKKCLNPFEIPSHWRWVKFGDIVSFSIGKTPSRSNSSYWSPGVFNWVSIADMKNYGEINDTKEKISKTASVEVFHGNFAKAGSILMSFKLTIGKVSRCKADCFHNEAIISFQTQDQRLTDFLFRFLPIFSRLQVSKSAIMGNTLNKGTLLSLPIALPPLDEQKRIVAKVDELMALCDRLEAQLKERDVKQAALAKAALAKFTEEPTPENLQLLFHPSFSIEPEDLKKLILNLAIKGKLTAQNPADEPAHRLLERIVAHNTGGKRGKSTPAIADSSSKGTADIPDGWIWARFGEIVVNRDGERIPVSKEIRETKAKIYDYYGASGVIDKIDSFIFSGPLLLIGEDGANLINRSTPIAFIARGQYWVNNHAHVLDGISEDLLKYLEIYINAINLEAYVTGSAQPKMNQAKLNSIPIALPPMNEQQRIAVKVAELQRLVDQLEAQLEASRTTGEKLLEAMVAELTAA